MHHIHTKETAIKRHLTDYPISKQIKLRIGKFLLPFFNNRTTRIQQAPFAQDLTLLDRLVRNGIFAKAFVHQDHEELRRLLSNYWGEEAKRFHESCYDRFERMFLKHDVKVIDELEAATGKHYPEDSFQHLYEIGCGGGQLLNYLSDRLTDIKEFVGIDLGKDQIISNQNSYCHNEKLTFHAADATEWITKYAKSHSIFVTNGGVFEYFLMHELENLFQSIATQFKPAAVILVETIGSNHDLSNHTQTFIYGREMSFSHNYPFLLKKAGFKILHQSEREGYTIDGGGRWLRVLAIKE